VQNAGRSGKIGKSVKVGNADFSMVAGGNLLVMAIIYGYNFGMEVSTAEAKNRLTELIRVAENGEKVVITRHGKPVAQLGPVLPKNRKPVLGGMKGRIRLLPGWDDPITEEELLGEDV
jgi:prevent-host-death family protein